ncbi:hypothetical protein PF006_g13798 [Phytophthora fragariae]|uniref:SWIM-type domain-containing protein n=1 Tax=Phytophthora fragariae TaxID=53985 RepID=A0A6A3TKX2_9STRA|nr:hypothetical protein PF011_g9885 [Phytophthora fragariae]KAE9139207.1 hypothetical protein PF006_g13798 [Phytophthora fragariae]
MSAEIVHRVQGTDLILVRISLGQRPADFDEDLKAVAATAAASGGWVVDATGRSCMCPVWKKSAMCFHVIKATQFAQLPCPGLNGSGKTWSLLKLQQHIETQQLRGELPATFRLASLSLDAHRELVAMNGHRVVADAFWEASGRPSLAN